MSKRKRTRIPCKACEGRGYLLLAESLETVLDQLKKHSAASVWWGLAGLRVALANKGVELTSPQLAEKLGKLVDHGLVVRDDSGDVIQWRAKV